MATRVLTEIEQQPAVLERLLAEGAPDFEAAADLIGRTRPQIVLVAARGSSAYAGTYGRSLIETMLGIPVLRPAPVVSTVYRRSVSWPPAVMIALSQAGESPDTLQLVSDARAAGIPTIGIVNEEASSLAQAVDCLIPMRVGPEAVTATKSYMAEIAILAAIVARWARDAALRRALESAAEMVDGAIRAGKAWLDGPPGSDLVVGLANARGGLVTSRGHNLGNAKEIALKLTETSGIFTSGISAADFLHGHIVLATPDSAVLAIRPDGPTGSTIDQALQRARDYGARQWIVGQAEVADRPDALMVAEGAIEAITPLAFVVPGQLLAERVARARGEDPDQPRGLVKVIKTL